MSNELDTLISSRLFGNCDRSVIEKFHKTSEKQTFAKEDVIYVEHSANDKIYFLTEGSVHGEVKLSDSENTIDFNAGDFLVSRPCLMTGIIKLLLPRRPFQIYLY